jgi:hypothetical protein
MRLYNLPRFSFIFIMLYSVSACGGDPGTAPDVGADVATDENTVPDLMVEEDADSVSSDPGVDVAQTDEGNSICSNHCDCPQGESCVEGNCVLGDEATLCCGNNGCTEGAACSNADGSAGLCGVETSPLYSKVIINEVLIDGTTDGDPNQDGEASDAVGDEFVEIINMSAEVVDIGDCVVVEKNLTALPRHTFASGRTLAPGKAIVLFGGGTAPDDTEGSSFVVANAADPGIPLGLHLNDDNDDLRILDKDGRLVAAFSYGENQSVQTTSDQSLTRNPDGTGDFVPHTEASGDETQIFSPGTRIDGSSF